MSELPQTAFNLLLAATAACFGALEVSRPEWLTQARWRKLYHPRIYRLRGSAELVASGLLVWPPSTFIGSSLLLASAVTVAVALLIDGECRVAFGAFAFAIAAAMNGYLHAW